jgi:hypothetical protein
MSTTTTIRNALIAKLQQVPNLPELAIEAEKYSRTVGTPSVRFKLAPAQTFNDSIGANAILTLNGLAFIDVFYPALRGTADAEATAQAIVAAFSPQIVLDGTDQIIIEQCWVEASREDPTFLHLPVVVRWRAFSA